MEVEGAGHGRLRRRGMAGCGGHGLWWWMRIRRGEEEEEEEEIVGERWGTTMAPSW